MKRSLSQTVGFARFRFVNGVVFIILGLAVLVEFLLALPKIGLHPMSLLSTAGGYVLGFAFIALGYIRLRAGWPRK